MNSSYPKHPTIKPNRTIKRDIVRAAQKQLKGAISREVVAAIFTSALEFTEKQLIQGYPVEIPGWGAFSLKRGRPKMVKIATGERVLSGTHRRVKFLTSSIFTELIRHRRAQLLLPPPGHEVLPPKEPGSEKNSGRQKSS